MDINNVTITQPGEGLAEFTAAVMAVAFERELHRQFPPKVYWTLTKCTRGLDGRWDIYWFIGIPDDPEFTFANPGYEPFPESRDGEQLVDSE